MKTRSLDKNYYNMDNIKCDYRGLKTSILFECEIMFYLNKRQIMSNSVT